MDKKSFFAIFVLFVVFLLVSGVSCPINLTKKPNPADAENNLKFGTHIYEGNDGLVVQFVKDVPPARVYSGEPLTVAFDVLNKGATSVGDNFKGYLYISGADPNIVQFVPSFNELVVAGKGEVLGDGGYSTVSFNTGGVDNNGAVNLPGGTDSYKPKFIGTVCYEYETRASPVVCLDPDPFSTYAGEKACKVTDVSLSGGQGAPIAVTQVEQMPTRGATQLKIHFKNVGKGKVVMSDKISSSPPGPCIRVDPQDYNYINKIDSYDVQISNTILSGCSPPISDGVRLTNNEGVIICKYSFNGDVTQAFTAPISINLRYGYVESTTPKEVEILNVGPTTQ
jgi:hypothetical protein